MPDMSLISLASGDFSRALLKTAGFEWGSGFYINPVSPEQAGAELKKSEFELNEGNL